MYFVKYILTVCTFSLIFLHSKLYFLLSKLKRLYQYSIQGTYLKLCNWFYRFQLIFCKNYVFEKIETWVFSIDHLVIGKLDFLAIESLSLWIMRNVGPGVIHAVKIVQYISPYSLICRKSKPFNVCTNAKFHCFWRKWAWFYGFFHPFLSTI